MISEWLGGKDSLLVYGPSQRTLAKSLGKQPILLLTSHNDEAGLLLQISCSPQTLYLDYVKGLSKFERLLEALFLRPLVYGIFLETTEWLLEVFSLGVPWWKALLFDFDATSQKHQPYYPPNLLVEEKIDISPKKLSMSAEGVLPDHAVGNQLGASRQLAGLPLSIQEVKEQISRQIHLRHSAYYENDLVIHRVADFLTGGELKPAEQTKVPSSRWTSDGFWEALLAGNIALGILLARVRPIPGLSLLPSIADYFFRCCGAEFVLIGIPWLFYISIRLIRRQWSSRSGR